MVNSPSVYVHIYPSRNKLCFFFLYLLQKTTKYFCLNCASGQEKYSPSLTQKIDVELFVSNIGTYLQTIPLSITNKMQCYTIFFISVNALLVSGSSSVHHQELKTVHIASGICQACLLLPLAVAASKH